MNDVQTSITPNMAIAAKESIKKGSLSFALASMLLPKSQRAAIHVLYRWCRHCDDHIDDLPHDLELGKKLAAVQETKDEKPTLAIRGKFLDDPIFDGFGHIARQFGIPSHYPLELIHGMWLDANHAPLQTEEELIYYSYCVAGNRRFDVQPHRRSRG